MKNTLILVSAISMLACVDTGKETGEDTGTAPIEYVPPTPTVTWGASSVSLAIANAEEGAAYNWGIAENAGECLTSEWGCWTGEDCHRGFALSDGGNLLYCHPVTGDSAELTYGAATDAVAAGSTTVFSADTFSTITTHILDNSVSPEDGSCWVWGADTSYYDRYSKACTSM